MRNMEIHHDAFGSQLLIACLSTAHLSQFALKGCHLNAYTFWPKYTVRREGGARDSSTAAQQIHLCNQLKLSALGNLCQGNASIGGQRKLMCPFVDWVAYHLSGWVDAWRWRLCRVWQINDTKNAICLPPHTHTHIYIQQMPKPLLISFASGFTVISRCSGIWLIGCQSWVHKIANYSAVVWSVCSRLVSLSLPTIHKL